MDNTLTTPGNWMNGQNARKAFMKGGNAYFQMKSGSKIYLKPTRNVAIPVAPGAAQPDYVIGGRTYTT